jgi:hypothetical protein
LLQVHGYERLTKKQIAVIFMVSLIKKDILLRSLDVFVIPIILIQFLGNIATFIHFLSGDHYLNMDFVPQLLGAVLIKSGYSNNLYDLNTQTFAFAKLMGSPSEVFLPYRNVPLIAFVFTPFLYLTIRQGFELLFFINVALLLASLFLINKILHVRFWAVTLFIIAIGFMPIFYTLCLAQTTVFILFVCSGIYYFLNKDKPFLVGLLCSLLLLKLNLFPLSIFIFVLVNNKLKFLKGFLLGIVPLVLINLLIGGWSFIPVYFKFLFTTENELYGTYANHIFSINLFLNMLHISTVMTLIILFLLHVVLLLVLIKFRTKFSLNAAFSYSIFSILLLGLHVQVQDTILVLIPLIILFNGYMKSGTLNLKLLIFLALYILFGGFWGSSLVWINTLLLAVGVVISFI